MQTQQHRTRIGGEQKLRALPASRNCATVENSTLKAHCVILPGRYREVSTFCAAERVCSHTHRPPKANMALNAVSFAPSQVSCVNAAAPLASSSAPVNAICSDIGSNGGNHRCANARSTRKRTTQPHTPARRCILFVRACGRRTLSDRTKNRPVQCPGVSMPTAAAESR